MPKPKDLKGLSAGELEAYAVSLGEPHYRGRQLFEWIYHKGAPNFRAMSDLPAALRARLESEAAIGSLELKDRKRSSADGTTKLLFGLEDGRNIESVLIPPRTAWRDDGETDEAREEAADQAPDHDDAGAAGDDRGGARTAAAPTERLTLCVSTQVGCPLDCAFCATATMGLLRNLTAGEIVDQAMSAARIAGRRITNLVYMGMGEPLLNYEEVMKSVEIASTGLKIAAKRITISTAGWVPGIRRMADEKRRAKLAISLHTLDEKARVELMPVTKFPLAELLDAADHYYARTKQRITFEYILFEGWNDSDEDVRRLAALVKRIPGKVNIIPFHSIAFSLPPGGAAPALQGALRPAPPERIDAFANKLRERHVTTFVRSSAGEDINAACGQLAVKHAARRATRAATSVAAKAHGPSAN